MMYNSQFVVVIKHNGKICREYQDVVYLPFGAEYTIGLKNLNSVRAVASVTIDGEDVLDGKRLIVEPDSTFDLDGYLKGSKAVNKFKFIEKTKKIEQYRGNRIDDGIVRVEFQFEQCWSDYVWSLPHYTGCFYTIRNDSPIQYQTEITCNSLTKSCSSDVVNDDGITVKGTEIDTQYSQGYVSSLSPEKHVITLLLKGKTKRSKEVTRAITTRQKLTCRTCGKRNKSSFKYCGECGTYLLD